MDKAILLKLVNPNKLRILEIIEEHKEINQLKIKEKINLSYTQVRKHVKDLEKMKIVKTKKIKKKKGSPRVVSLR